MQRLRCGGKMVLPQDKSVADFYEHGNKTSGSNK
jgi:hypothetical protein